MQNVRTTDGKHSKKSSLFAAQIENDFSLFTISGEEMLLRGLEQVKNFGASIIEENVITIDPERSRDRIRTEGGAVIDAWRLILTTGSKRHKRGVPGEKTYLGRMLVIVRIATDFFPAGLMFVWSETKVLRGVFIFVFSHKLDGSLKIITIYFKVK